MKKERKKFFNKILGYTCIQLIDDDLITSLLDIEDTLLKSERNYFNNKDINILHFNDNNNLSLIEGKIISSEKNRISYNSQLTEDSLGLPLIFKASVIEFKQYMTKKINVILQLLLWIL